MRVRSEWDQVARRVRSRGSRAARGPGGRVARRPRVVPEGKAGLGWERGGGRERGLLRAHLSVEGQMRSVSEARLGAAGRVLRLVDARAGGEKWTARWGRRTSERLGCARPRREGKGETRNARLLPPTQPRSCVGARSTRGSRRGGGVGWEHGGMTFGGRGQRGAAAGERARQERRAVGGRGRCAAEPCCCEW